jgi:hypothetical protein
MMPMMLAKGTIRMLVGGLGAAAMLAAALAPAATASPFDPSGVLRLAPHPNTHLNTNQSTNWFGYNAGTLERGTLFNSVTADWTVPTASAHKAGEAESSATWIGIGGGCLDANCGINDATLVQTGTEQDVDASGHATYSAWWELVPVPAVTISKMSVSPGDHIHASVAEAVPNAGLWTITLEDVTKNESFSTTVPYVSTHSTAEWIEETPLTIGSGGTGQASLPGLTPAVFTNGTVNGASARLAPAEELQLIDSSGNVIGTPSAPNAQANGFAACAWASSCALPTAAPVQVRKPAAPVPNRKPAGRRHAAHKHKHKHHAKHRSKHRRRTKHRRAR